MEADQMNVRGKNRGKEKRGVRRAGLGRLALREAVDGRWIQESARQIMALGRRCVQATSSVQWSQVDGPVVRCGPLWCASACQSLALGRRCVQTPFSVRRSRGDRPGTDWSLVAL